MIRNKFELLWQKEIPPSEWNKYDYWEFEEIVKLMNERNKEIEEKQKKEENNKNNQQPKIDYNKFKPNNFTPKIPSTPRYK